MVKNFNTVKNFKANSYFQKSCMVKKFSIQRTFTWGLSV